jgi:tagatose-6-phosphate ketose/aldose isomerase
LLFTPAEIFQQPSTWQLTRDCVEAQAPKIQEFLQRAGAKAGRVTVRLIGAGTSDCIGRSVRALLAKQWRCEVTAVPSTDMLTNEEDWIVPGQRYLWIWFSRSGDSPESIAGLEHALASQPAVHHLVITCNDQGQLACQFQHDPRVLSIVLDKAVNDRGLAMTSSFSNMVVAAHVLGHVWSAPAYDDVFRGLVAYGEALRPRAAELCEVLARDGYGQVCFLGTGALNAVAHECALKVLELTAGRVHTMAHSSLGVRHGPLSGINDDTLVVSFLSGNQRRRGYETDLLADIRAKELARTTVAITPADLDSLRCTVNHVVPLEVGHCPDDYRPPVDAMFGQLLGLFLSLEHGLKPDHPSPNGAISRVVSSIRIYS